MKIEISVNDIIKLFQAYSKAHIKRKGLVDMLMAKIEKYIPGLTNKQILVKISNL